VRSLQVVRRSARYNRHPHRVRSRLVRNVRFSRHAHRMRSRQAVRRNVRYNRHPHRVRSRQAVRRNVRYNRHPHRVRSRRPLRQARSSRVSAAPAAPPVSCRVRLRPSSRSGRRPSLPPRYNRRLRLPEHPRRKRNAPSCRRRRIVPGVSMTCAARAVRCARVTVS
jgi:hypothetical protein